MVNDAPLNRHARGKRPGFYENQVNDQMMSMIIVLAEEVSVLADQLDSVQRVAATNGLDLVGGIEKLELDQQALEQREARRQALFERLFYLMRKEAAEAEASETSEGYSKVIEEIAQQ